MISKLVIVGLIVVWTIVLLPDVMSRISSRRGDTIRSFNSQLSSLRRSSSAGRGDNVIDLRDRTVRSLSPVRSGAPHFQSPAHSRSSSRVPSTSPGMLSSTSVAGGPRPVSPAVRKRRQDVLVALGAAAGLALLATVAFGGFFLYLFLMAAGLFATYLVLLQQAGASRPRTRSVSPVPARMPAGGNYASLGSATPMSPVEPRRIAN